MSKCSLVHITWIDRGEKPLPERKTERPNHKVKLAIRALLRLATENISVGSILSYVRMSSSVVALRTLYSSRVVKKYCTCFFWQDFTFVHLNYSFVCEPDAGGLFKLVNVAHWISFQFEKGTSDSQTNDFFPLISHFLNN